MKKKLVLLLSACSMLTLAACGATPKETEAVVGTEEVVAGTEIVVDANTEEITLVYHSMWNEAEPQGVVFSEAAAAYEEANPNITVEIVWQGRDITKIIGKSLDAGEQVDIFDGPTNTIMPDTLDYALDMTPYYAKTFPTTGDKTYGETILKSTQDIVALYSNENEVNGVPYAPFVQCIFYNKDHFEQAGITENPETWEDFLVACEKLKEAGFAPMTIDDAYMPSLPGYYLARAKGGDWVSALVKGNTEVASWEDPAVLEMANAYVDMMDKGYFHENTTSNIFPAGQQTLASGEASMYLNASWLINELMIVTGEDFPWGQMQFPGVPNGEGNPKAANYASNVFEVNKNSANVDAAVDFVVYLTTGDIDAKYAASTYSVPAAADSEWPVQLADSKEIFVDMEEWIPWAGGMEDNGDVTAIIKTSFTELLAKTVTPEEFVQKMVDMY